MVQVDATWRNPFGGCHEAPQQPIHGLVYAKKGNVKFATCREVVTDEARSLSVEAVGTH